MKLVINQYIYINSFYANLIYLASTQFLLLLHLYLNLPPTLKQLYLKPLPKECLSLSYSLVGMKFAQFLSCRVLTLACLVDQMDRMSRENFFQAPVEHRCRLTVVSIYHSNLVCFRQPSKTSVVVRRLLPLEFVRRIQPLDCFRNQLNRLSRTKTHAVSSKRSLCSPQ